MVILSLEARKESIKTRKTTQVMTKTIRGIRNMADNSILDRLIPIKMG